MNSDQNGVDVFKQMAVRVAAHYCIADVQCWDQLPESFRHFIIHIDYKNLIVPLVWCDRESGQTWQQLSIKYRVSVQTIRTILTKRALVINATTPGKRSKK